MAVVVPLSNKIYAQGCMEVHRGVWRYAVVHRWVYRGVAEGIQRNTEVAQRYAGAQRCIEGCVEVHGGADKVYKVGKGTQRCAEMHRFAERCTEVC